MKERKAAVLFINGQSNAHAHGQFLPENERITEPMKHVFSLDRDPNQSFEITDVVWSGFTTAGKNLGEIQDHTASFAYYTAKQWESAIDNGADLPDLYIVQISIGSQGLINGMWNRDKEKVMKPGKLGEVNISLYPWALQVNRLVMENLKRQGLNPQVIGWHWFGSEQEVWNDAYKREDLPERYDEFFDTMIASMGGECPVYFYKLYMEKFDMVRLGAPENVGAQAAAVLNAEFERQIARRANAMLVRAEDSPYWDAQGEHLGIFAVDNGHYLAEVQQWYAEQFFAKVCKVF